MSNFTAEGRRRKRDFSREAATRQLNKYPIYAGLPGPQRVTLSELRLVGRDLYADIKRRGVMLPDGTVNPAVEAHRKNAQTQLRSLQVFMELNAQKPDATIDLVTLMSGQGEPEAAAEPAGDPESETK